MLMFTERCIIIGEEELHRHQQISSLAFSPLENVYLVVKQSLSNLQEL